MATVLGWFVNCGTSCIVVIYLIYVVCAEESKLIPEGASEYYQMAAGQRLLDEPQTVQHSRLESEDGSLFFRIILPSSRLSKPEYMYQDHIPNYGGYSKNYCLPNATLMICFSIVLAYMGYITIALMFKPVLVEDHANPAAKVLLSNRTFSDSIVPPKLRGLYEELEFGSSETLLGIQKTDILSADDASLKYRDEKSVAGELRVFSCAT